MAQEHAAIVRRLFEAVSRRDYDAVAELFAADAEWHNTSAFPGAAVVHGGPQIARFLEDMFSSYGGTGGSGMEIEEVTEGTDVVVTRARGWWRSGGGVDLETRWAQIFRFRDGRVSRVDVYGDHARALEAARLDPTERPRSGSESTRA
jgi:uncharacterized protein